MYIKRSAILMKWGYFWVKQGEWISRASAWRDSKTLRLIAAAGDSQPAGNSSVVVARTCIMSVFAIRPKKNSEAGFMPAALMKNEWLSHSRTRSSKSDKRAADHKVPTLEPLIWDIKMQPWFFNVVELILVLALQKTSLLDFRV